MALDDAALSVSVETKRSHYKTCGARLVNDSAQALSEAGQNGRNASIIGNAGAGVAELADAQDLAFFASAMHTKHTSQMCKLAARFQHFHCTH